MTAPHPYLRYVAIGDSMTEGLGDPDPAGGHRGWADRLAEALAERRPACPTPTSPCAAGRRPRSGPNSWSRHWS